MAKTTLAAFIGPDGTVYGLTNVQDWNDNFADPLVQLQSVPGMRGGFDPYGNSPSPNEKGAVQANFILTAATRAAVTALIDALRKLAGWGRGTLIMQTASGQLRWCYAKVHNISDPHVENRHSDLWHRVQLTFSVDDPVWRAQGATGAMWSMSAWGDAWSTAISQACSGVSTGFTATHSGNETGAPVITIACAAGQTAQDVTVQRIDASGVVVDQVKYTGTLVANDTVVIDCGAYSVTLNGSDAYTQQFQDDTLHPAWMRIEAGTNKFQVVMANAGDACTVTLEFYDTYR